MAKVDRNVPLYKKLADSLKERIFEEKYQVGDLLPTEELLQREFNSSRTTVRNAIDVLEKEGYVKKYQGRGTEICSVHPKQDLNYLSSISDTLSKMYGNVTTGSLTINRSRPSVEVQKQFEIEEADEIYSIIRTKIVQGRTIAYLKNILLAKRLPDLEDQKDSIQKFGLYRTVERVYDIKLDHAIENISVYMSGPLDSEIFDVHSPIPLYCSKRKTYLANGTLFEMVTSFIRAEDFEYTVYLKGRR
jgi:DNA-binding GntR family transcriptional regulator